jgi:ATP-dependent DNA ligase
MQQTTDGGIQRGKATYPVFCYLFDCLYLDGRPIVNEPLARRREWLADAVRSGTPYRLSEIVEDGPALFEAVKQIGLEGIMAKDRKSVYSPGRRSDAWLKIKAKQTLDCAIIGYTRGAGDRGKFFGALHLGQVEGDRINYVGKVGSGFNDRSLKAVFSALEKLAVVKKPVQQKNTDDSVTIWVESKLVCEVQFASVTKEGLLREPVFLRLRPDLSG